MENNLNDTNNNKSKYYLILVLSVLLIISIGFAYLSTTLNIRGNANIGEIKWKIKFANIEEKKSINNAKINIVDDTNLDFSVTLNKPGDAFSFTVDIINEGTIDAMISQITKTQLTERQKKFFNYNVSYVDGTEIENNHLLKAGQTEKISVTVDYKKDINEDFLLEEDENLNLAFGLTYIQADEKAIDRAVINTP